MTQSGRACHRGYWDYYNQVALPHRSDQGKRRHAEGKELRCHSSCLHHQTPLGTAWPVECCSVTRHLMQHQLGSELYSAVTYYLRVKKASI